MTSIEDQHDHLLYKMLYLVPLIQYRYMYVHIVFHVNCIEINGLKSFYVASLCFQLHIQDMTIFY